MTPANRLVGDVRNNGPEMLNSALPATGEAFPLRP